MIGKKHSFMLFTLGLLYAELNEKLQDKYLRIAIPKYIFIELIQRSNITEKKARAIYKNLETLEKQKLISYENQNLSLTAKGTRLYQKIYKEYEPYINLFRIINREELLKFSRKSQTVFKL